jgi:tetratricopeptide (TPR) repeat protein
MTRSLLALAVVLMPLTSLAGKPFPVSTGAKSTLQVKAPLSGDVLRSVRASAQSGKTDVRRLSKALDRVSDTENVSRLNKNVARVAARAVRSALAQGQTDAAAKWFTLLTKVKPSSPRIGGAVWTAKGYTLGALGKYAQAYKASERAVALTPGSSSAWTANGFALEKLGREAESMKAYDRAIRRDPTSADAWNGKGNLLLSAGTEAAERGDAAGAKKAYLEALKAKNTALRQDKSLSYVWYDRGIVLLNLGRYSTAAASFDKAIQLEPRDADAWRGKGLALRALGDAKGARSALAKARRLG